MKVLMKNAYRMLFFLMAVSLFNCSDDDDNVPADTEAPVITLNGPATVNLEVGDPYTEQGATATDNVDGDISDEIVVGGDQVDVNTEGTYTITYNVSDEAGNEANEVTRTVIVSVGADTEAPVITLIGEDSITITEGDEYTDEGATATDDRDGDITENIVVGGDEVDTATPGTYVITYNVDDAAGNPAEEVTRTVIVEEAPATCAPDAAQSVSAADLDITFAEDPMLREADGLTYTVVDNPDFDNEVNESCNVAEVIRGDQPYSNFQIDFDTKLDFSTNSGFKLKVYSSNADYRVLLKMEDKTNGGISTEVFDDVTEVANEWNELTFDFEGDQSGKYDRIVVFLDFEGEEGTYFIDDFALYGEGGGDTTPPVITLNGNSTINIANGDTFEDPGATATDNVDGDISENIQVGGDEVDVNTNGTYVITYNVTDAAGNEAEEVTRTVNVTEDGSPGNLASNGDFEAGDGTEGWLFFTNGGIAEVDNTISNGGNNSAKIETNGGSNPGIKQERIGVGTVQAGDVVQIQFDHIGSLTEPGAVFNVLLFIERAEGEGGDPITHIFDPRPALTDSWTTFTATYTIPDDASVTGGISFLIESVCGGDAGCEVSANVDNVSVTLNP